MCIQSLSLGPNPLDCGVNNGCYKKCLPQSHSAINLYALFCVLCDMAMVLWCFATWQLSVYFATWQLSLCPLWHGNCPCVLCNIATILVCFVTWQLPLCALQCYCSNCPCMLCDSDCPCVLYNSAAVLMCLQLSLGVLYNSATVFVCFATWQLSLCALQLSSCPCVLCDLATVLVCFVTWLHFSFSF